MTAITVELPPLHAHQREVARSGARFKVLACGRRWGKTRLASLLCTQVGMTGGRAWWVAPTYPMSNVGWRLLRRLAIQVPGAIVRESERLITFPSRGQVQVRSGDNPDALRGDGLDFVALDECAFMLEACWTEALRPALADRQGRAVFISTPKGRNWYWQLWQRGIQAGGEWQSWRFPTSDNPFIAPTEIEAARDSLPEHVFKQEFLAEFLENEGAVFRNIAASLTAEPTTPEAHRGHRLVMGVDWGKQNDFTVLSVGCVDCGQEVFLDRFNQIDYHVQRGRLLTAVERWQVGEILAESNSIGEPNIEELRRAGLPVLPFTTTLTTKPPLIEALALDFDRGGFAFLPDAIGRAELEAYECTVNTTTGRPTYSAPEGLHDDTVMSRALMRWQMTRHSLPSGGLVEVSPATYRTTERKSRWH